MGRWMQCRDGLPSSGWRACWRVSLLQLKGVCSPAEGCLLPSWRVSLLQLKVCWRLLTRGCHHQTPAERDKLNYFIGFWVEFRYSRKISILSSENRFVESLDISYAKKGFNCWEINFSTHMYWIIIFWGWISRVYLARKRLEVIPVPHYSQSRYSSVTTVKSSCYIEIYLYVIVKSCTPNQFTSITKMYKVTK